MPICPRWWNSSYYWLWWSDMCIMGCDHWSETFCFWRWISVWTHGRCIEVYGLSLCLILWWGVSIFCMQVVSCIFLSILCLSVLDLFVNSAILVLFFFGGGGEGVIVECFHVILVPLDFSKENFFNFYFQYIWENISIHCFGAWNELGVICLFIWILPSDWGNVDGIILTKEHPWLTVRKWSHA